MRNPYQTTKTTRTESITNVGTIRGGQHRPVDMVAFHQNEGGVVNQNIMLKTAPIAGQMLTPITATVESVFVPALAIDAQINPEDDYPGNAEVYRQKLLTGNAVFPLGSENELSKAAGIEPISINGEKKVSTAVRAAYHAAINYLRRRKYVDAAQVETQSTAGWFIQPAPLSQTVLDRLNAVLDPEDRVNGAIDFGDKIAIEGAGFVQNTTPTTSTQTVKESDGELHSGQYTSDPLHVRFAGGKPQLYADMNTNISLTDFYLAERQDSITRQLRDLVEEYPEYGEEMVGRFAHGLSVDVGSQPFVAYKKDYIFNLNEVRAMDGDSLDVTQTNGGLAVNYSVVIPRTEFGGILVTLVTIRPDETLAHQPHPFLAQPWGAVNYVADEMAIDPVPVTVRELYADCDQVDEETVVAYIGNNGLKKRYVRYGFDRLTDLTTVENKTALWQIEVPLSVTPESILYPEDLDHYPFADQEAHAATFSIRHDAVIGTPFIFGPDPVEETAAIEDLDIFGDEE